ncbi:Hypothetical protein NTJ_08116 [Nesidiocoris tenuis]|nr:Hypothetical protein NTJ_08116 [Nesidiocoris tenuis]
MNVIWRKEAKCEMGCSTMITDSQCYHLSPKGGVSPMASLQLTFSPTSTARLLAFPIHSLSHFPRVFASCAPIHPTSHFLLCSPKGATSPFLLRIILTPVSYEHLKNYISHFLQRHFMSEELPYTIMTSMKRDGAGLK